MNSASNPLADDLDHVLVNTESVWTALRNSSVFVTGGTGFIGTWLVESLVWANLKRDAQIAVTILTRDPAAFARKAPHLLTSTKVTLLQGDVRSFTFPKGDFQTVIHAATSASAKLNLEAPLEMIDTIIEGTRRTLDFAAGCGTKNLLNTSSCGIYGRQPPGLELVGEDYMGAPDPLDLWSTYSEAKRLSELMGAIYASKYKFGHKVARISSAVGPHLPLDIHFAIGNFIRDALAGGPIKISGDGTPHRANLYISDTIIWLWTILINGVSNRAYNVGSERSLSLLDTAKTVSSVLGGHVAIDVAQRAVPGVLPSRYVASTKRAREELGLKQLISLEIAVLKTVAWHQRSPDYFIPLP